MLEPIFYGIIIGGLYALVAIGYTLIYGVLKFINFAHGEIFMLGSYFFYYFAFRFGLNLWESIALSMFLTAIAGVIIEQIAYRPLRTASRLAPLISAIGVSIFIRNLVAFIFGSQVKSFVAVAPTAGFRFVSIRITSLEIYTIVVTMILMLCLTLFLKRFKFGKAIRAIAVDQEAAKVVGIKTDRIISLTFAIASAMAAAAGCLFALKYNAYPAMGGLIGFKAFTASVLGGIGSVPGAMVGGLLLGLLENLGATFISHKFKDAFAFVILVLILVFRPEGLYGTQHLKEVKKQLYEILWKLKQCWTF